MEKRFPFDFLEQLDFFEIDFVSFCCVCLWVSSVSSSICWWCSLFTCTSISFLCLFPVPIDCLNIEGAKYDVSLSSFIPDVILVLLISFFYCSLSLSLSCASCPFILILVSCLRWKRHRSVGSQVLAQSVSISCSKWEAFLISVFSKRNIQDHFPLLTLLYFLRMKRQELWK